LPTFDSIPRQVSLTKSAKTMLEIIGQVVYGRKYDGTIKNGMRNRKIAEEICEYKAA